MNSLIKWGVYFFFIFITTATAMAQDGGITIDANGNTGIGTETPSATLDVNGNTKITGNLTITDEIQAQKIKVSSAPTNNTDAVNKAHLDQSIAALGLTLKKTYACAQSGCYTEFTLSELIPLKPVYFVLRKNNAQRKPTLLYFSVDNEVGGAGHSLGYVITGNVSSYHSTTAIRIPTSTSMVVRIGDLRFGTLSIYQ
ncbi:MAG: hypothetical protein HUN04_12405 [Desulfobacter sp.]|nr:MAG: hypothetical protein HUN04_12405 [Desulfobacter sp.]